MNEQKSNKKINLSLQKIGLITLLIIIGFGLLTGAIYFATQKNIPGTDFFIYYAAGRNIVVKDLSPYNNNVGEESQLATLGRLANIDEDQLRFVNPPFALLPVLPFVNLPFPLAQAAWMSFGLIILLASFRYAIPEAPSWLTASILMLYPTFFGFLLGNFDILIISLIFILVGQFPKIKVQNNTGQILLGVCLAWITVKPQFTWFYCLFFLLLALRRKLIKFFLGFATGFGLFLTSSFLLVPNWVSEWTNRVLLYPSYTGGKIAITPFLKFFFPDVYFSYVYFLCFLILAGISIPFIIKKWYRGTVSSLPLLAFGGFITFFFHPHGIAYEQLTFLIPVILWIVLLFQKHPGKAAISWVILVSLTWLIFIVSRFGFLPGASTSGLYFLYTIWLVFGLLVPPRFLKGVELINKRTLPKILEEF